MVEYVATLMPTRLRLDLVDLSRDFLQHPRWLGASGAIAAPN